MGSYKNPMICDEKNLRAVSEKLQKVTIVCGDYRESADFIDENTFKNKQRDLFKYGEIDGIEIYYKPYKCYRWDTTTHLLLPFDFFGVPDAAEAAELYLVCKDKVGYIYLDYNPYNLGMVFSGIVHPLFVYRPMINFDEIISSITDKRQSSNQGTAGNNQGPML